MIDIYYSGGGCGSKETLCIFSAERSGSGNSIEDVINKSQMRHRNFIMQITFPCETELVQKFHLYKRARESRSGLKFKEIRHKTWSKEFLRTFDTYLINSEVYKYKYDGINVIAVLLKIGYWDDIKLKGWVRQIMLKGLIHSNRQDQR